MFFELSLTNPSKIHLKVISTSNYWNVFVYFLMIFLFYHWHGKGSELQGTCYHTILLILSSEDCEMKARWLPEVSSDSCYFSDPELCNSPSDNSLISWSSSILCLHLVLSPNVHLPKPECYMTSCCFRITQLPFPGHPHTISDMCHMTHLQIQRRVWGKSYLLNFFTNNFK